jgi:hypothetical protein
MESQDYINVVKEQLRAYDFVEIQDEELEEIKNELQETDQEEELTPEEEELVSRNSVFIRIHENGVHEEVVIVELEKNTVDEVKKPIRTLLSENEDEEIEQDPEIAESHFYYLFVATETSKPLHTVTDQYTFEGKYHGVLPVLVDTSKDEVHFKNDFSLFEDSPFLRGMSDSASEFFIVSP